MQTSFLTIGAETNTIRKIARVAAEHYKVGPKQIDFGTLEEDRFEEFPDKAILDERIIVQAETTLNSTSCVIVRIAIGKATAVVAFSPFLRGTNGGQASALRVELVCRQRLKQCGKSNRRITPERY